MSKIFQNAKGLAGIFLVAFTLLANFNAASADDPKPNSSGKDFRNVSKEEWRQRLNPQVYQVTRCSATEPAFSGKYWNTHDKGVYKCSNCGKPLFDSDDKFDSGTGWPSFTRAQKDSVETKKDHSMMMTRDEVICKHCGAHLGHVFADGPAPTGQRFCINSASLELDKSAKNTTKK